MNINVRNVYETIHALLAEADRKNCKIKYREPQSFVKEMMKEYHTSKTWKKIK